MSALVETMAYYGETPWHKLGIPVDHAMTAKEALQMASLDWTVSKKPIYVNTGMGESGLPQFTTIADKMAIVRDSDGKVLGVMGDDFQPLQNTNAFDFTEAVAGQLLYETAGSLDGGKRIWILARLPDSMSIKGDEVKKYVLLANGHDGTQVVRLLITPIRVVCNNTLTAALTSTSGFYGRHTKNLMARVTDAQDALAITRKWYATFEEQANYLAGKNFAPDKIPLLLNAAFQPKLLPQKTSGSNDIAGTDLDFSTRWINTSKTVTDYITVKQKGASEPSMYQTCYGALNGIVEYLDYSKHYMNDDTRFKNVFGQQGLQIKSRAMDYLIKI